MRPKLGKRRLAKLQEKFPLSSDETRMIQATADAVWGECAFDVLEGSPRRTVSKAVVMEIVLDADRLRDRMRRGKVFDNPRIAALFPERYEEDASDYLYHIVSQGFQYPRYGL